MISQLSGDVIDKQIGVATLDVHGVGYEVLMSELDMEKLVLGTSVRLHTYFHVRENAQELFGFTNNAAKALFKQLISVNGVGPKSALNIMGLADEKQIKIAIASSNIAFITGASGVGKKAAQKIILDLKEKVGVIAGTIMDAPTEEGDEAYMALLALGFSAQHAQEVLAKIDVNASTQQRVKLALKELQR